tara:strand:+ start:4425 stop:4727 length:303 start_codon:yes stop_codon:yes gene_type:complete
MDTNRCRSRVIFQVAKNRSAQDSNARNRLIQVQRDINHAKHGSVKLRHLVVELRQQESQQEHQESQPNAQQEGQPNAQQESQQQQQENQPDEQQEKQESQ